MEVPSGQHVIGEAVCLWDVLFYSEKLLQISYVVNDNHSSFKNFKFQTGTYDVNGCYFPCMLKCAENSER